MRPVSAGPSHRLRRGAVDCFPWTPPTPSLFEQLQQRLAAASEPLEVLNQFEAELLYAFPAEAPSIVELVASWGYRLGVLTRDDLDGYV